MKYKDQLKTSAWLRKKYEVMSRDNSESQLEVHHITYHKDGRNAWEYNDYMLVTLCRQCHQKEHDENNIKKPNKIVDWIIKIMTK